MTNCEHEREEMSSECWKKEHCKLLPSQIKKEDILEHREESVANALRTLGLDSDTLFTRIKQALAEGREKEARKCLAFVDVLVGKTTPQEVDQRHDQARAAKVQPRRA